MSRSTFDYDFDGAHKPCIDRDGREIKEDSICIGKPCWLFECCDLSIKNPPEKPTAPKRGRSAC